MSIVVSITMAEDDKAVLKDYAYKTGRSFSSFLVWAAKRIRDMELEAGRKIE